MAFYRTTIRGKVPGDIYQFGFVLQSDDGISNVAGQVKAQFLSSYGTAQRADYPSAVTFDDVLVQELATGTGAVVDAAVATIGTAGTAPSGPLPPQCAVVVSVLPVTGIARGRFYLPPMTAAVLGSAGRLSTTVQTRTKDAWQGFFAALGAAGAPARLGIWRTGSNTFAASKGISVGDVIDTQRRRRNKLIEVRVEGLVL